MRNKVIFPAMVLIVLAWLLVIQTSHEAISGILVKISEVGIAVRVNTRMMGLVHISAVVGETILHSDLLKIHSGIDDAIKVAKNDPSRLESSIYDKLSKCGYKVEIKKTSEVSSQKVVARKVIEEVKPKGTLTFTTMMHRAILSNPTDSERPEVEVRHFNPEEWWTNVIGVNLSGQENLRRSFYNPEDLRMWENVILSVIDGDRSLGFVHIPGQSGPVVIQKGKDIKLYSSDEFKQGLNDYQEGNFQRIYEIFDLFANAGGNEQRVIITSDDVDTQLVAKFLARDLSGKNFTLIRVSIYH